MCQALHKVTEKCASPHGKGVQSKPKSREASAYLCWNNDTSSAKASARPTLHAAAGSPDLLNWPRSGHMTHAAQLQLICCWADPAALVKHAHTPQQHDAPMSVMHQRTSRSLLDSMSNGTTKTLPASVLFRFDVR